MNKLKPAHYILLALVLILSGSSHWSGSSQLSGSSHWQESPEDAPNDNIIYEYEIITQKKGELLSDAIKYSYLDSELSLLLNDLPIYRVPDTEREFRLTYSVENGERFISEVQMSYDDRMANFVLIEEDGEYHFESQTSQIPNEIIQKPLDRSLDSPENAQNISTVELSEPSNSIIPIDPDSEDGIPIEIAYLSEDDIPIGTTYPSEDDAPVATTNLIEGDIPIATTYPRDDDAPVATTNPIEGEIPIAITYPRDDAPVVKTSPIEDAIPIAITYPSEDDTPVVTNPIEEDIPIATTYPREDDTPVVTTNPIEDDIPIATTYPREDDTPVVKTSPIEDDTPVVKTSPIEEGIPIAITYPREDDTPVVKTSPIEDDIPIATTYPREDDTPVVKTSPIEDDIPIATTYPREDDTPVVTTNPIEEDIPIATTYPREDDTPVVKTNPIEDDIPIATTYPIDSNDEDYQTISKEKSAEILVNNKTSIAPSEIISADGEDIFGTEAPPEPKKPLLTIPKPIVKAKPKKDEPKSLITAKEKLFALSATQKTGQSLNDALKPLNLSQNHLKLINAASFLKKARRTRTINAYFTGHKKNKLLRGLKIINGKNKVSYTLSQKDDNYYLRSFKVTDKVTRKLASSLFKSAKVTQYGATVKQLKAKAQKKKKKAQGRYRLVVIKQKKSRSLSSTLRSTSLSSAQRRLINDLPISSSAKSTRTFRLLFEHRGASKYLRAVRITRSGKSYEYALTKYLGKWKWTDRNGTIKTNKRTTSRGRSSGGFLRYPLNFKRISSSFNPRRRHPITRRIRPHNGTDFKARHGTPIWAPASGVVTFAGRQRGYGIVLIINHGGGYKTKYAHLSRIMPSARRGKRVRKRQIIARVGNTGFSTGAHLHYEVLVNGRARNPMTVHLPSQSSKKKTTTKATKKTLSSAKKTANKYLPQIRRLL